MRCIKKEGQWKGKFEERGGWTGRRGCAEERGWKGEGV